MTMPQLDTEPAVDDSRWVDGTWMLTATGRFSTRHPRPEDVRVEDIAHQLGMLCRFNGATSQFYSVAEHSVLVARILADAGYSLEVQFMGLMHDATEPYVGDLIRPVKVQCLDYQAVEHRIWTRAIAPRFELPEELPDAVKRADNIALFMERRDFLHGPVAETPEEEAMVAQMPPWVLAGLPPTRAKEDFLDWFARLNAARA